MNLQRLLDAAQEYMAGRVAEAGQMTQGPFHAPGGIDQAAGGAMGLAGLRGGGGYRESLYQPRFMSKDQMNELINLWHLSRTALSGKAGLSDYQRAIWASGEFGKKYPAIGATAAYKDLMAQLGR